MLPLVALFEPFSLITMSTGDSLKTSISLKYWCLRMSFSDKSVSVIVKRELALIVSVILILLKNLLTFKLNPRNLLIKEMTKLCHPLNKGVLVDPHPFLKCDLQVLDKLRASQNLKCLIRCHQLH